MRRKPATHDTILPVYSSIIVWPHRVSALVGHQRWSTRLNLHSSSRLPTAALLCESGSAHTTDPVASISSPSNRELSIAVIHKTAARCCYWLTHQVSDSASKASKHKAALMPRQLSDYEEPTCMYRSLASRAIQGSCARARHRMHVGAPTRYSRT